MSGVQSLLFPGSIAVVGASPRNVAAVETVVASGVRAWGVNPNHDEVAGLRCYPSVAELPEVPECAFLMVNHERVEAAFEEAAAAGVRAFVVPGVGAEAGTASRPTTERLGARAREVGATLLGPNCMGFVVPGGAAAWNGRPQDTTAPGHVAVLCQSGSIADAFLALGGRIGLRCVVSSGAEAVTDAADFLAFFADDAETRAVGLFLETVRRPGAFVDALRRCAEAGKAVVCLKVGRSEAAARAALTHTGALVGSERAFSAVLRRYAAIEVDDFHELLETLEILGQQRWPSGRRIAGISESGGECALLADHAEAAGIPFEPLSEGLAGALTATFPNYVVPGNPLDAWGIADETEVYPRSLELLAESGEFDVLVAQADLSQFRDPSNDEWCELTLRALARLAGEHERLFCAMTTVHSADPPRRFQSLAHELDVPLLRGPRDAMLALARVARRGTYGHARPPDDIPDVSDLLDHRGALPEHESALVLERFGVPFAERRRATTPEEAGAAVDELGAPVVIKRDGPTHKARAGAVVLGITSPDEAAEVTRRFDGPVLVARQVEPGVEVLCGMTRDPDFGPILAVGPGGVDVEHLDRVATSSAPLGDSDAARLVSDAGIEDPHGIVARTLVVLSDLGLSAPDIESIEVNPLIVGSDNTVAVDALVVVADRPEKLSVASSDVGEFASTPTRFADRQRVRLRPVRPETSYARSGDLSIAYQVLGDGPFDLVYVPGFVSHVELRWTVPSFARGLEELAEFSRLILFDKRGTGMSDPVVGAPTLEARMDDLRAVMDAVGSQRAALLGVVEGAAMSALFAATYPNRTAALVLRNGFPRTMWAPDYPWGRTDEQYRRDVERELRVHGPRAEAERVIDELSDWNRDEAAVIADYLRWSASPGTHEALARMNREIDVRHVLSSIRVPTLVLHGSLDPIVPLEAARWMTDRIPGARLVALPTASRLHFGRGTAAVNAEVRSFLTELHESGVLAEAEPDRVLATVLFTDIVDASRKAAELGDRAWRELLERHHSLVRQRLLRYRGVEVDTAGDGFLASFDGPARAISCASSVVDDVRDLGIEVRAGLHTGECELVDGKVAGIAVHTGARVAALAGPGEVIVSSTVKDLVAGSGIAFADRGTHELKGVPGEWRLFAVASIG